MRYLILASLLFLFGYSCYKADERHVIKGQVVDTNNIGLSNIEIGVIPISENVLFQKAVRSATTDNNGNFEIILANGKNSKFIITFNSMWGFATNGHVNRNYGEAAVSIDIRNHQNFEYTIKKSFILGQRTQITFQCNDPNVINHEIFFNQSVEGDLLKTDFQRLLLCNDNDLLSVQRYTWFKYSYKVSTQMAIRTIRDSVYIDKNITNIKI